MTDEQNLESTNDDVFIAEADEFDDDLDAKLPAWPKVVGVISIVWGSLSVICNGLGAISALVMPALMKSATGQMQGGMPPVVTDPPITSTIAAILGLLVSVFLVIAGVMTVMRKASGRTAHLIYGMIQIILIIWGIVIQIGVQGQIADWVNQNPDADFSKSQQLGGSFGLAIAGVMAVIFLIWPIFTLVWFGAIKKTHQDMTGGVDLDVI